MALGRLAHGAASQRGFRLLWGGQTLSALGSQLTLLALPTIAITTLSASPVQVGLLMALQDIATPLLGLVVGVWVDQLRRRPILIWSDVSRALVLAAAVAIVISGRMRLEYLYIAATLMGVFGVFSDVANQSFVPLLVSREQVVDANAKLEATRSSAHLLGPLSAGALIHALGSAWALGADAASFVASAVSVVAIRVAEHRSHSRSGVGWVFRDIREGLSFVWTQQVLRLLVGAMAASNLGFSVVWSVLLILLYRTLHLNPAEVGIILSLSAIGFIAGAAAAARSERRLGPGLTLLISNMATGVGLLCIPITLVAPARPVLIASMFIVYLSLPLFDVTGTSLRQLLTPDRMRGRVNATFMTITWGINPVGALAGGFLGSWLGIVPTIFIGGGVALASSGFLAPRWWRSGGSVAEMTAENEPLPPGGPISADAQRQVGEEQRDETV